MQKNIEIKEAAKRKGVFLYEVADALGMVDSSFSRKSRTEYSKTETEKDFKNIDEIAAQKAALSN